MDSVYWDDVPYPIARSVEERRSQGGVSLVGQVLSESSNLVGNLGPWESGKTGRPRLLGWGCPEQFSLFELALALVELEGSVETEVQPGRVSSFFVLRSGQVTDLGR